ncbi:MAG: allantoinase AllB [Actinomycetota bacterium]|nr:allantoinase AllB [Actinomycetota bacterium]
MSFDAIIRTDTTEIALADGVIAALEPAGTLADDAREIVDAHGLDVLPGLIDAHVHFNDPGRASWEGWGSGTRALAAGGFTCGVDMPLNSDPPTVNVLALEAKLAAAKGAAHVDFAVWGGLVPGNVEHMEELAAAGVVGFKAFMADSGIDDFAACDDLSLYEGMCRAAQLGLPVAVHAENAVIVRELGRRAIAAGRTGMADFAASRPVAAEVAAIATAIAIAEEAGCALHIAHVSSGRGAVLVAEARAAGADVSCETCPHYLALSAEDAERIGVLAKCAPPLRNAEERHGLRRAVRDGTIDYIASDHSPAPPRLKEGHAFSAWGGISGCQTTARVLLAEGLTSKDVAFLCSVAPALRLRLPGGLLEPGANADLLLLDPAPTAALTSSELEYRHPHSPFTGRALRGRVARTMLRGRTVAIDGRSVGEPRGQFVWPLLQHR